MAELISKIKRLIIRIILSFFKNKWADGGSLKVLITVNKYFSETSWENIFATKYNTESQNWDIVLCKNRFDVYKHFSSADICFLYGYGSYLIRYRSTPKLLYFPLLGLEFLINKQIPENFKIEKPQAYAAFAVAEYCIAMTIVLSRNIQYSIYNQFNKKWDQRPFLKDSFISILTRKIGILGVGSVGKVIAECFKRIGCYTAGFDKNINRDFSFIDKWYNKHELSEFLKDIDVLIISISLNEETKNFIGMEEFKMLGPSAYLINISRGDIINEKDLIKALNTKIIKGAVLDTFDREPLSGTSALYNLDNLIITPHIAGNINLFVNEIQEDFIMKVLNYSGNV
jgi:D-2-hydroxyacid dehydrogenase (NADP+)